MKCVSYTRSLAWRSGENKTIGQQNEIIKSFMKNKGLRLSATYSDRKQSLDDDAGFNEMVEDALLRKLDCVVVDSIAHFGVSWGRAYEILFKTFYPIGIHFCIVDDDFCSFEKSREEIEAYSDKQDGIFKGTNSFLAMRKKCADGILDPVDEKYGYKLTEDRAGLVVDEEVAWVVRDIFLMRTEGKTTSEIARYLNAKHAKTPGKRKYELLGKPFPEYMKDEWEAGRVSRILRNSYYIGKYEKKIGDETISVTMEPLITPEIFNMVQKQKKIRAKRTGNGTRNRFFCKIIDGKSGRNLSVKTKDNGEKLFVFQNRETGERVTGIQYAEVVRTIRNAVESEREETTAFKEFIYSEQAQAMKDKVQAECSIEANRIFSEMLLIEQDRIPLYDMYKNGNLSEKIYNERLLVLRQALKEKDDRLEDLLKKIISVDERLSEKNQWYKAYSDVVVPEEPGRKFLVEYIKEIIVEDFSKVHVKLNYMEWKIFKDIEV